ncbi:unnamed protein product [Linum tenue]|uniref:Uncharacterized protein n=1 Tax=Linum tenue TaxID=586396 RepID=A0AAV0R9L9_9ROSI|nr:unnamed protein product [Linum tenue]
MLKQLSPQLFLQEPDAGSVSLTREKEKNLLISLSKVYKEIQVWIREMEVDSDEETMVSECLSADAHEQHNCLMKVLADLILLLTVDSQYVQHSAGKIVVAVSELLAPSVSNWDSLVRSLWMCLELIVKHLLSCSPISNANEDLHFGSSSLMFLNRCLGNADWSTASHVIQILRNILKNLKEESDENRAKQSTFQYFTHKLLVFEICNIFLQMLLLRLSYGTHISCTTLVSWLKLLHDYFEELLLKPMSKVKTCQNDCLEGSPFLSSVSEGEAQHMGHSLHSQRQAILLFLRCCFSLISSTGENTKQLLKAHNSLSAVNMVSDPDFSGRSKGFIELYKWFQAHLRDSFLCGKEMHVDKCILFARSFLQLYLHELHYDHQVLLDYLISKDLGISCAEYLLRLAKFEELCSNHDDFF